MLFVCDAVPYHVDEDVSAPGRNEMDQTLRVTECLKGVVLIISPFSSMY